jgi:alpha-mannosidase
MRREPDFKWYIDAQFEALRWSLDRHPEGSDELKRRVREGRFGIAPGSFCNPDTQVMEPEAMVRNIVLGRRDFERKFPGVNLEVAVFNDIHTGYTQFPQLLRQASYRYYPRHEAQ